jgi:acetyl-CoA synthetase
MRFANALKTLGVQKGDRVCIYMPMVPEQVIAMLACARIGAVHTVVFGGFGVTALNTRINDAEAKVWSSPPTSACAGARRSPSSILVEEAIINAPRSNVVVLRRKTPRRTPPRDGGRLLRYHGGLRDRNCEPEEMDAEDPLFILYTSGSTGTPKGVVHTTGGYMVGTYYTTKHVFDIQENDVYWCTADPGWITGHSYIIYGPLMYRCDRLHLRIDCPTTLTQASGGRSSRRWESHLLYRPDRDSHVHEDGRAVAE